MKKKNSFTLCEENLCFVCADKECDVGKDMLKKTDERMINCPRFVTKGDKNNSIQDNI